MSEVGSIIKEEQIRPQLDPDTFAAEQQKSNPWIQKLATQGISLDIPSRFFRPNLPEQTHIDPLTGLPIDNDGIRIEIASKLSHALHEGGSWVFISTDAD